VIGDTAHGALGRIGVKRCRRNWLAGKGCEGLDEKDGANYFSPITVACRISIVPYKILRDPFTEAKKPEY
jgi:hypothetical protein